MAKKLIMAAQNEIIRKSADETDILLGTLGLSTCAALIIYDNLGNTALAHIDRCTDLLFINHEIERLNSSPITLKIVRHKKAEEEIYDFFKTSQTKVTKVIEKYIEKNFPYLTISTQTIDSDSLVISDKAILPTSKEAIAVFKLADENQLSREETNNIAIQHKILRKHINCLYEHVSTVDEGPNDFQLRIYTHSFFTFFMPHDKRMPDLVYADKKWATNVTSLNDNAQITHYMSDLKQHHLDLTPTIFRIFTEINGNNLDSYSYFDPEFHRYEFILPEQLNNYWNYMKQHPELHSEPHHRQEKIPSLSSDDL